MTGQCDQGDHRASTGWAGRAENDGAQPQEQQTKGGFPEEVTLGGGAVPRQTVNAEGVAGWTGVWGGQEMTSLVLDMR